MLLPLKDSNPLRVIPFQFVTVATIALCAVVFLWQLALPDAEANAAVLSYGLIPSVLFDTRSLSPELARLPAVATVITSMFLHGGWMHLLGNMLYLWIFGDNVEDAMGHGRFVAFYLICGIAAGLAHAVVTADSTTPMIGASGAISGVLGAYLVLHPRVKVLVLLLMRIPIHMPAYIVLGIYIALQFFYVATDSGGNTALWAHIGGFAAGALLVVPFRRPGVPLFDQGTPH